MDIPGERSGAEPHSNPRRPARLNLRPVLDQECSATIWRRELYASPNGDRWFLVRDEAKGRPFVPHEPNPGSGGLRTELEIGSFLVAGGGGPEHQELLRLIGTLAEGSPYVERPPEPLHSHWEPAGRAGS